MANHSNNRQNRELPFEVPFGAIFGIIILILILVFGCNTQDKDQTSATLVTEPEIGIRVKFDCLQFDSVTIANWLQAGKKTRSFIFQFYTADIGNPQSSFILLSYSLDSAGNYSNAASPDTLRVDPDSTARTFPGKAVLGNNGIGRKDLELLIAGTPAERRPFDYILFLPKLNPENHHIVYELFLVKNKMVTGKLSVLDADSETHPSPPAPPES